MIRPGLYEKYLAWESEEAMDSIHQSDRIDTAVQHLPKDTESILCIGVGDGYELVMIDGEFPNIRLKGITLNTDAVHYKHQQIVWGDMHNIEEADSSYDLVFSKDCFEHSFSHWAVMSEMARVSKRYVMIVLPDVNVWSSGGVHTIIPTSLQLKCLAEKFNLKLVDTWSFAQTDGYLYEKIA